MSQDPTDEWYGGSDETQAMMHKRRAGRLQLPICVLEAVCRRSSAFGVSRPSSINRLSLRLLQVAQMGTRYRTLQCLTTDALQPSHTDDVIVSI